MAIFMISPREQESKPDETVQNTEVVEQTTKPDSDVKAQTDQEENIIPTKEIDEKTIVLDGPLSQIYTEALNQMYAKESYISNIPTLKQAMDDNAEKKVIADQASYVYVVNGHFLENDGIIEAFDSITYAVEHMKNVYVCVEHDMNITPKVAQVLEYSRNLGVTVLHNREKTIAFLSERIKH